MAFDARYQLLIFQAIFAVIKLIDPIFRLDLAPDIEGIIEIIALQYELVLEVITLDEVFFVVDVITHAERIVMVVDFGLMEAMRRLRRGDIVVEIGGGHFDAAALDIIAIDEDLDVIDIEIRFFVDGVEIIAIIDVNAIQGDARVADVDELDF